jgi:uncharacterized protein YkwD
MLRSRVRLLLVTAVSLATLFVAFPTAASASAGTALARGARPSVEFVRPDAGATLTASFSAAPIEVAARVPGSGRANGAGVRWVRIKVIDRATGKVVASVTDRKAPFVLATDVPDGAYRIRAVARATAAAGGTTTRAGVSVAISTQASPAELASLRMINEARAAVGAAPLTLDPEMSNFARDWSVTMSQSEFRHSGGPYAENIAAWWGESGLSAEQGARRLHDLWMGSPPHYANLTNPNWTKIGVGIHHTSDSWWGTHVFA